MIRRKGPVVRPTAISSCCALLCMSFWAATVHAKATIVTLAELTKESQLIVYGHMNVATGFPPSQSITQLQFKTAQVLKGNSSIHDGVVALCNRRPNTEWPDLARLTGDAVLFLTPSGDCFDLSHNYRSVVKVHDNRATTGEIKDQPEDQSLGQFLGKIQRLSPKE